MPYLLALFPENSDTTDRSSITCQLITNDDSKTPVARFNNAEELGTLLTGPKSTSAPSSLEIFPAGAHMVDLIVVTFVYVEKLRKEREKAADEAA